MAWRGVARQYLRNTSWRIRGPSACACASDQAPNSEGHHIAQKCAAFASRPNIRPELCARRSGFGRISAFLTSVLALARREIAWPSSAMLASRHRLPNLWSPLGCGGCACEAQCSHLLGKHAHIWCVVSSSIVSCLRPTSWACAFLSSLTLVGDRNIARPPRTCSHRAAVGLRAMKNWRSAGRGWGGGGGARSLHPRKAAEGDPAGGTVVEAALGCSGSV